ncbi:hypothetical protein [Catelliglobosispora koreensis]|uniref:hypothetical protein n=1 Tax=Catelliglobosispora koreensis TaxID=129052 RepID=UPI0012FA8231|nr:hypothetical protein [Catelliglobosispora koreensis]
MTDGDYETKLACAAQAMRELEILTARCEELRQLVALRRQTVAELTEAHAVEARDVTKLEKLSLTRVIASLRGSRDNDLAREKAEAEAARYRVAEAQARLDTAVAELQQTDTRRASVSHAPQQFRAALADKERALTRSGGHRGNKLAKLAEERGTLAAELTETEEARDAAASALEALGRVDSLLSSASNWSTYDTFFGGGIISSSIKHSRLDEAARAADAADDALTKLRHELADVQGAAAVMPGLAIGEFTRFADVWFDNIFSDLSVRGRIKDAQANVEELIGKVRQLHARLEARRTTCQQRLQANEAERSRILL